MCAVQALYQWAVTDQCSTQIEENFIPNRNLDGRHLQYFKKIIFEVPKNIERIDSLISPHLSRELESIDLIEHAILRVGAYELIFEKDIPGNVIMDEAIDLAKEFASEHGYKFVNGVLDKIAAEVRKH